MRILLLTQVAPYPPDAGPKVKTYYLLKKLSEIHDIELITFVRDARERDAANELHDLCSAITTIALDRKKFREPFHAARGWATGMPFLVSRDRRTDMFRAVGKRLETGAIDVVHADQLSMAQYLPRPARAPGARTVFDAHNAVWKLVQSLVGSQPTRAHQVAAALEWRFLKRFEGRACLNSDLTLAVSEIDVSDLRQAAGEAQFNVTVAPIGIEARETDPIPYSKDSCRIISVATMHYPPNADALRWFRDRVWPLLSASEQSAGLDIVGSRPPEDIKAWSEASPDVRVHGYVDELAPLFARAGIFVVPLQSGSGIRVKILEAMARGLPVISTSVGIEGLPARSGEHLLVADDPGMFARSIGELLGDPERRRSIGAAAREFSLRYDWRVCLQPVIDAYSRLENAPSCDRTGRAAKLQTQNG